MITEADIFYSHSWIVCFLRADGSRVVFSFSVSITVIWLLFSDRKIAPIKIQYHFVSIFNNPVKWIIIRDSYGIWQKVKIKYPRNNLAHFYALNK